MVTTLINKCVEYAVLQLGYSQ